MPNLTLAFQLGSIICSTRILYVPATPANPHCDGKVADVLVGLTLAQLQTLRSTTGGTCHRDLETDGKVADVLAPTHTCTTANDNLVNYRGCLPQRPENFPSPRWEIHILLVVYRAVVSASRVAR
jgi:hypothetical protein